MTVIRRDRGRHENDAVRRVTGSSGDPAGIRAFSAGSQGCRPAVAAIAALLGGLGLACGKGSAGVSCDPAGPASVKIGGGSPQTGFVNLADGGAMTVVLGPQGLNMITPSIRAQGVSPGKSGRMGNAEDPLVALEASEGGSVVGASARARLGLMVTAEGAERLGIFLPFSVDPPRYLNKRLRISASIEDACGRTASGELEVTAVP